MDWKALAGKASEFADKAVKTGKEALAKTTDFTYENIRKTPVVLKNGVDFENVRMQKKLVVFAIGKDDPVTKSVLVQLPVLFSKAWTWSATLKLVLGEESADLVALLDVPVPSVSYYKEGERQFCLSGADLEGFLQDFDLKRSASSSKADSTILDDLAAASDTHTRS